MFSKKYFILGSLIGIVLFLSYLVTLPDDRLHVVFCDVGQGDAAYIRAPNNMDMLIDGGPNDKVLNCLGRHMPFYDRTIDVVMLSHAQKDHLQGLISVLERYEVKNVITTPVGNETEGYKNFIDLIKTKNIPVKNLFQGDEFYLGKVKFKILWPERKWVAERIQNSAKPRETILETELMAKTPNDIKTSHYEEDKRDQGKLIESKKFVSEDLSLNSAVLGLQTDTELNSFSYFVHLNYGTFDALFTGDGDRKIQPEIMDSTELPDVDVLKFPHHGSKTAILSAFLDRIKPELTVISVGKNSYGHPTKEALDLLKNMSVETKRTDREGDIEIISDGKSNWTN